MSNLSPFLVVVLVLTGLLLWPALKFLRNQFGKVRGEEPLLPVLLEIRDKLHATSEATEQVVVAVRAQTDFIARHNWVPPSMPWPSPALLQSLIEETVAANKDSWKRHEKQIDALAAIQADILALAQANRQLLRGMYGGEIPGDLDGNEPGGSKRQKIARIMSVYGYTEEQAKRYLAEQGVYQTGDGMRGDAG